MFKRKDKQDVIHQTNLKRGITSHFARTLKVLQQRHLQSDSDEFIYSDDYSNNLCSALEAVFLHGLKDSVASKMSSYVGLASAQDQAQYINFWGICAKFTHSDVVTQLRSLAQINTDIGLCRAWIRIALNDGLMESYIHSMIVDHKLLTYYYHSYSYLRDHEQPGILKNFLTGLMSISFKLSFNSSVLNAWNNTSLQLAGVLDSQHIPHPAMSKSNADSSSSLGAQQVSEKAQEKYDPIIVTKSTKTNNKSDITSQDGLTDHPMFSSIQDVEEIRRITLAKMGVGGNTAQSVISEGSTSSHISCPDSAQINQNSRAHWERESDSGNVISPALYPRADREIVPSGEMKDNEKEKDDVQSVNSLSIVESQNEEQDRRGSKTSSVIIEDSSPFFDLEIAMSPPRPRSRRVMDDDLIAVSPTSQKSLTNVSIHSSTSHSLSNSPKPSDFALRSGSAAANADRGSKEIGGSYEDIYKKESENTLKSPGNYDHDLRNRGASVRGYEEICATLPPIRLDPLEQEAILRKVLGEIDEQADKEREKREEQRMNMAYDEAFEDLKVTTKTNNEERKIEEKEKSKKVERDSGVSLSAETTTPQLQDNLSGDSSNVCAGLKNKSSSLNRSSEHKDIERSTPEHTSIYFKDNAKVKDDMDESHNEIESDRKADEKEEVATAGFVEDDVGSSSPMSGNFGNSLGSMTGWSSEIDMAPKEKDNKRLREKTRGESFASMLRTYATGGSGVISTTLDQVIQTFYGDQNNGSPPSPAGLSPADEADMVERQDSCLDDFEVLSPSSDPFYNPLEMDTSRSIFLFRIPREHGLSHQNFICRGCSRPIGIIYGQPRLCEFDGGLYCYECHENNEAIIPSYIIYNWDFSKRKVAVENYKFLQALDDQALYDLDDLNPKLETHIPEIGTIKVLRHQLCFLKSYMFNCTQKVAESLRQRVWPREHLYERASVYSLNDFHQVQSGLLIRFVKDLVKFASKHVYQCSLCNQKGFVCEICRNPQVIFPFELDTTIRCSTCKSVYHKTCMTESLPCPKCERWGRKDSGNSGDGGDHPEDYGTSPTF